MKAELLKDSEHSQTGERIPAGTVIDHPQAWLLVRLGRAIPADDECRRAAAMTDEQMQEAQDFHERLCQGRATGDPLYDAPDPQEREETLADDDSDSDT